MDIIQDIKHTFKKGDYLIQLIYINLAVFLLVTITSAFSFLWGVRLHEENILIEYLSLPAYSKSLLHRIWTPITYMFLHQSLIHILFNLLWLYWFGKMFLQYFDQKHLLSVYIVGGLSGALCFVLTYNLFPVFEPVLQGAFALGASAAVYSVVFAVSTYVPNLEVRFAFLGNVKLKYIAMSLVALDLLSIRSVNAGSHIAHLGGAVFGFWFACEYKKGRLITKVVERILDFVFTFFKPKPKMNVSYKKTGNVDRDYQNKKGANQATMNTILEKISKSGYSSLSKEEKELLFKMSDKK